MAALAFVPGALHRSAPVATAAPPTASAALGARTAPAPGRPSPAGCRGRGGLSAACAVASLCGVALRKRGQAARGRVGPRGGVVRLATEEAVKEKPAQEGEESEAAEGGPKRKQRVLSGVQPTGDLHLGNYFGAIAQWVGMQEDYDCFFCIVDLHAITVPHNPRELRRSTLSTAAAYLASGIDPEKSTVFVQSSVPQHASLNWLLTTQTPMNWLSRATQYKEKAVKQGESVCTGLFAYPVLMAADILLYGANKVPVGEDQQEHLFLARDIASRMNELYKKTVPKNKGLRGRLLTLPEPLIGKEGARVMALDNGRNKMSKSAPAPDSRICFTDTPADITRKIKRCTTDSITGVELNNPERPEANNLLRLYALCRREAPEVVAEECKDDNWGIFKGKLTEALIAYMAPMQDKYQRFMDDEPYLRSQLEIGRGRAIEVASQTLENVEEAMGFYRF